MKTFKDLIFENYFILYPKPKLSWIKQICKEIKLGTQIEIDFK